MERIKRFGLVGKNISYSFSKNYFSEKFERENLRDHVYQNFDIDTIVLLQNIIKNNSDLLGFNVTIPYKEVIIPYLNDISKKAKHIGAVNTVKILKNNKLKGYNTDFYGFKKSLKPLLKSHHKKALILGTGGASKAVAFALEKLGIIYHFVSRNPAEVGIWSYDDIDEHIFNDHHIIINTTPLGTYPNIKECPPIPYSLFTDRHIAYDLIYNPEETFFLSQAKIKGATIKNGFEMLVLQAEKAWKIWNKRKQ